MRSPFELLGVEPRLVIDREEINQAFREAGKSAHPDAGGNEEQFSRLQEAAALLQSPSRRLQAWLEAKGVAIEARGAVGSALMDLFGLVGETTQSAEAVIRKREGARTALAKALLEDETQRCREQLERVMRKVEEALQAACSWFSELERSDEPAHPAAMETLRDLRFLEKWQASLRSHYSRMF